jgi:hypothetical protein
MTQKQIADAIGKDTGWVSRNLRGPGNWTLRTVGAFVEALDGEIEISIRPLEEPVTPRKNFHAYAGYEPQPQQAPVVQSARAQSGPTNTLVVGSLGDVIERARRGGSSSPVPTSQRGSSSLIPAR